jgi:hypothetical protein
VEVLAIDHGGDFKSCSTDGGLVFQLRLVVWNPEGDMVDRPTPKNCFDRPVLRLAWLE